VNGLAPIDAQPPNLREEMCGGHRRKPPSEDNEEEPDTADAAATGDSNGGQGFMLSSLAKGKFVLGPPVDTEPPVIVFTGPADHPDAPPAVAAVAKKKPRGKHVAKAAAETQSAEKAKPAHAKPATKTAATKKAKPKAGAATQ
jgi:D-alanyl-D-alanine carboxypeptidase